jgi:hypothetical protein
MTKREDLIVMLCESYLACVSEDDSADETILSLAREVEDLLSEHKLH